MNGRPQPKAAYAVRPGDLVGCNVLPPPPLEASPEELPLDIVYEDEHLLVVNKVWPEGSVVMCTHLVAPFMVSLPLLAGLTVCTAVMLVPGQYTYVIMQCMCAAY